MSNNKGKSILNEVINLKIKPVSVNQCWKGRRFKTDIYKGFENELYYRLPKGLLKSDKLRVKIEFGFSNKSADFDNPIKPFMDILQKKYEDFDDKQIYEAHIRKVIVSKGSEYIKFMFEILDNQAYD